MAPVWGHGRWLAMFSIGCCNTPYLQSSDWCGDWPKAKVHTLTLGCNIQSTCALQLPWDAPERRVYPSGNEAEECAGGPHNTNGTVAAVVTVAFNRPDYLERHIASLLSVHSSDPANRCAQKAMAAT